MKFVRHFHLFAAYVVLAAGCAARDPAGIPPCGVTRVESSGQGLKVFFDERFEEIPRKLGSSGLMVFKAKSPEIAVTYSLEQGQLLDKQSDESPFLLLHPGDRAGTFHGFGGCGYVVQHDEFGAYLAVDGAEGDLSDYTYSGTVRPTDVILAYKPSAAIEELRDDLSEFAEAVWTVEDERIISLGTSTVKPPFDGTWNASDPDWARIRQMVRNQYLAEMVPRRPPAQARAHLWDRTMAFHLTKAEIEELLVFFRSDVGRRFILLQHHLQPLENEWRIYSADRFPGAADIAPTNPAVTPHRVVIMTLALGESPRDGATPSDVSMISAWAASHHGPELDSLYAEHETDIAAFQTFSRSPALLKLLKQTPFWDWLLGTAAGKKWQSAENNWLGKHEPEWRAAYRHLAAEK
jgi:hypothetical protein